MALQVNYKNLYEIISELEETTSCPACGTNLANAERNPYEYAKEQLKTFTEIELIQKKINDAAQNARENICEILDFISGNQEFFKLLQIKTDNMVSVELEDIRMYVDTVSKWFEFCEELKGFDKHSCPKQNREEYNKAANKSNSEYDQQVAKLSAVRNALVTLKTQMNEKEQIIKRCQKEIKEFDEQSEDTIKENSRRKKNL